MEKVNPFLHDPRQQSTGVYSRSRRSGTVSPGFKGHIDSLIAQPASGLTLVVMDLTLWIMGDKSPKAAHKHAQQKQVKAQAAKQKKNNAASAKQVPKTQK
jgi:hypothetical protein